MCGVIAAVGRATEEVERAVEALQHRGPDASGIARFDGAALAHTRLAIVDLDRRSDQPMRRGKTTISFNGEIWNHREVRAELEKLGKKFRTKSDTEVFAWALDTWGVAALPRLNGMFAVAWERDGQIRVARDRFGECPLHIAPLPTGGILAASERKALRAAGATGAIDLRPGQVALLERNFRPEQWYAPPIAPSKDALDAGAAKLRSALEVSCLERAMSDAPRCCLLSGGIDSSVVAALLRPHAKELVAYTARMDPRSPDLRAAREVAGYLEIPLVEVDVAPPTADDLSAVVEVIEQPSKAQVEIGWACLALARRIRADGFKVTYSGEGSDELWGSYGFAFHALKSRGWHEYRRDLFLSQARKNFPRCNKVFMAHSVECRLPFLNPGLVELALSLRLEAVQDGPRRPKAVLQRAAAGLLPKRIIDRQKLAFQDALGSKAAAARAVADPKAFYRAEFGRRFGG